MTSGIRNNWMQAIQKCMESSVDHRSTGGSAATSPSSKSKDHIPGSRRSYNGVSAESSSSSPSSYNSYGAMYKNQTESSIAHHAPNTYSSRDSTPNRLRRHEELPTTPRSASHDRYSSRFSTENAGDGSNRSASEPTRKISEDPNLHSPLGRKFSSTWPYASPESSHVPESEQRSRGSRSRSSSQGTRAPRSRSSSQNRSRRSSISDLLDEQEGQTQRELTAEEERELDNVQANIRRIHRKSITDSVSIAKLPHLDKFEQQSNGEETPERRPSFGSREGRRSRGNNEPTTQKKEETVSYSSNTSRELFASPGRARSPARSRSPGRPSWTPGKKGAEERPKSPGASKAPSVKIKDKTRSRSPRPKSPPPKLTTPRNDDYYDSLEKWKENRWVCVLFLST